MAQTERSEPRKPLVLPPLEFLPPHTKPEDVVLSDEELSIQEGPGELDFILALFRQRPVTFTAVQQHQKLSLRNCTLYFCFVLAAGKFLIGINEDTGSGGRRLYEGIYHLRSRKGQFREIKRKPN